MNTVLFSRIASALERRGDSVAIVAGGTALSGDELLGRSAEMADTIRALGVSSGDVVGIVVDRSAQSIVTMLALARLGCAYLPLDPTTPAPWREHLLSLAGARLLTCSNQEFALRPGPSRAHAGLAYVMGTSGTTGLPKAVPVTHASLLHYCDAFAGRVGGPDALTGTRMASVTTLAADLGNTMVFPALLFGAELHLVAEETACDPRRFGTYIRRQQIDALKVVPTHLRALLEGGLGDLPSRLLVVGGEQFDLDLLELLEKRAPRCAVHNHYGLTETTIGVAMRQVDTAPGSADRLRAAGHATVPVGTALGGSELRVVDDRLEPVAPGQLGELVIGGPSVAEGYPGNEVETERRFTAVDGSAERVFRSGDRARVTPDGEIELFGRGDRQFKVRGHRVEASGVEAVLRAHPDVYDAAVGVRVLGDLGQALVAWAHGDDVDESRLREHLRARLLESMVPSRIVAVAELPRTANGKIDRRALPDPPGHGAGDTGEDAVSRVIAEVLHRPAVAAYDDFFRLGGHSLAALRVIARLREEFGLDVAVSDFFADPRPDAITRAARPVTSGAPESAGPAHQVRALWTHLQISPNDLAYEIPLRLRVVGAVDAERVQAALTEIGARHEALRTRFIQEDSELVPIVDPTPCSTLTFDDVGLNLETGPMMRVRVTDAGPGELVVDLVVHHIVFDGLSCSVLARELASVLSDERLAPAPVARPQRLARSAPPLGEGARARLGLPPWQPLSDAPARCHEQRLPVGQWPLIESRAVELNTTPFAVVAAAWAVVLSRQDGEHAVTIGTPADLRDSSTDAHVVGYHVNVVVLEVEVEPDATARELVARTHRAVGRAVASRDMPYADRVAVQRAATGTPPTRTLLTIERLEHVTGANVVLRQESVSAARPMLGVDVCVLLADDGALLQIHHREDVCPQWRAECLGDQLGHVLRQIVADPDMPVAELDSLPPGWADRVRGWSRGPAVRELERWGAPGFLEKASENPNALALVWPGGEWTRSQLAKEIECTGRTLRDLGLGPGHVVAVSAPPSPALVVAWHAAHFVGAAVLALDPCWPERRRDVAARLARAAVQISTTDGLTARVEGRASADPEHPRDLAYLVLTSGSTGAPKTVGIQRSALANELSWFAAEFPIGSDDCVLAHTSPGFDVSAWEMLGPLAWGASLVFPAVDRRNDVPHLAGLMCDVTVTQTVPSLLDALLDHDDVDLSGLRLILCGGEELPASLAATVADRLPGTTFVNIYGPSETAIDATFWRVDRPAIAGGRVPIGRPIAGAWAHVVDDHLQPVPPGAFGQLAIGGNAVGLGYPDNPDETARRFVPDPFATEPGARLYLTGDRARWNGAGELEFGGRQDYQVKIRGNRVELEEVEAAMRALPFVQDAAVHPIGAGTPAARLAALVVPTMSGALTVRDLHSGVAEVLPAYLVPSVFGLVESLPRRANGKVDRDALPLDALHTSEAQTEWCTAMEEKVGCVWADLLGHQSLEPDLPFFASGGTSLLILALSARLSQQVGETLSVPELFEHATIRAQAAALERKAAGADCRTVVTGRGALRRQAIAARRRGSRA